MTDTSDAIVEGKDVPATPTSEPASTTTAAVSNLTLPQPGRAAGLSALMAAVLAACGGGGGGDINPPIGGPNPQPGSGSGLIPGPAPGTPLPAPNPAAPAPNPAAPSPTPAPAPVGPITATEAARFLLQAQLSASDAEIAAVQTKGYAAWLTEQMTRPVSQTGWNWLVSQGYNTKDYEFNGSPADFMIWQQLVKSPDGVRKRVALALSEILVVSANGIEGQSPAFSVAAYWDLLNAHAFGNYRSLLEAITLNPAMGMYLSTLGNQKEDPASGRMPDENYAREIMQLFSIGLYQLNQDGTVKYSGSTPAETYRQDDVTNLARIFTGYERDTTGATEITNPLAYRNPMIVKTASKHSNLEATFLGATVPSGADPKARLKAALDIIFNHPNVGPFIGRQLIQRLVTSNPSPAYIKRVAAAFDNNGSGVRGDLRAVVSAVLLDPEARRDPSLGGGGWGKLREPILRMVQWARTFNADSKDGKWTINNQTDRLGQSPLRSETVFNFFRPGYAPPNTSLVSSGLVAPEFQITNEVTVAKYLNYLKSQVVDSGYYSALYTAELPLAKDPTALLDRINLLMTAGQLSARTIGIIRDAVTATGTDDRKRVAAAIYLTMACPEYLVQK